MRIKKIFVIVGLLLILCACAQKKPPPDKAGVTVTASFYQEDGTALCGGIVQIRQGNSSVERTLDDNGEVSLSDFSRSSTFEMSILDRQERSRGCVTLSFSEGAVIDAATDDSGNGYITLRSNTEEIALAFLLKDDGMIQCALRLEEATA